MAGRRLYSQLPDECRLLKGLNSHDMHGVHHCITASLRNEITRKLVPHGVCNELLFNAPAGSNTNGAASSVISREALTEVAPLATPKIAYL